MPNIIQIIVTVGIDLRASPAVLGASGGGVFGTSAIFIILLM
jgi:hypothetical protein